MKDFCIQITDENREIVKEWWYRTNKDQSSKAWSINALYGLENGVYTAYSEGNKAWIKRTTTEEFLKLIEPDKVINTYLIY